MFKFNRLLCVVLVCALAGFAYSKAVKSKELIAAGLGGDLNPDVSGMIIMNFHDSATPATEVVISVKGLAANTTYGVQIAPGETNPLAFTTNEEGHGGYHAKVNFPFDISPWAVVRVFEWDGVLNTIGEVTYQELRAYGCTADQCNVALCETSADCNIGSPCHDDVCIDGLCYAIQPPDLCYDGDPCTHDYCSISNGEASCFFPPTCGDNDPCTEDVCTGDFDEYGNPICEFPPIANCP